MNTFWCRCKWGTIRLNILSYFALPSLNLIFTFWFSKIMRRILMPDVTRPISAMLVKIYYKFRHIFHIKWMLWCTAIFIMGHDEYFFEYYFSFSLPPKWKSDRIWRAPLTVNGPKWIHGCAMKKSLRIHWICK